MACPQVLQVISPSAGDVEMAEAGAAPAAEEQAGAEGKAEEEANAVLCVDAHPLRPMLAACGQPSRSVTLWEHVVPS